MLDRLLPSPIDNQVRGHKLALWLFYPIALISLVRSCLHIFLSDGGAQSIATIPLDTFTPDGAMTLIGLFAQWGLVQLLMAVLFAVVLFRYRALLSLMYLLLLAENVGRVSIGAMKPIVTLETAPGGPGSLVFIVVAAMGLILSLRWKDAPAELG